MTPWDVGSDSTMIFHGFCWCKVTGIDRATVVYCIYGWGNAKFQWEVSENKGLILFPIQVHKFPIFYQGFYKPWIKNPCPVVLNSGCL